jgi:hypothetical protein
MSKQVEVEFEVTAERLPIVDTIQPELIPVSAGCPSNPMDDLTSFAEASSRFASVSDWNAAMDGLSALDYSGYDEGDRIGYLRAYSDGSWEIETDS